MSLINLTPHNITLYVDGAIVADIPSDGLARVQQTPGADTIVAGVPVPVREPSTYGAVEGLPALGEMAQGATYVVSLMVAQALAADADPRLVRVVCPATGPADNAVRDEGGRIVGVTRLVRVGSPERAASTRLRALVANSRQRSDGERTGDVARTICRRLHEAWEEACRTAHAAVDALMEGPAGDVTAEEAVFEAESRRREVGA